MSTGRINDEESLANIRCVFTMLCFTSFASADVVVSEFMSNPDGEDSGREWIELYNTSDTSIDLSGWRIRDEDDDDAAIGSITIGVKDFIILVNNGGDITDSQAKAVFEKAWFGGTSDSRIFGMNFGKLHKSKDEIILADGSNNVVFSLAYDNDEDEDSTALLPSDFGTTSFGTKDDPGINRNGFDNGTDGFIGFEDSGEWASVFESDFNAIQDSSFLDEIGITSGFYDGIEKSSEGDPLRLSAVPEPSTSLVLLGFSTAGLFWRKRR